MNVHKPLTALHEVNIDESKCNLCGECLEYCPTNALEILENKLKVKKEYCIACYACVITCEKKAIKIRWTYK